MYDLKQAEQGGVQPSSPLAWPASASYQPGQSCRYSLMDFSELASKGVDKVSRYDWKIVDKPGMLQWINKHKIHIDDVYQRSLIKDRVVLLSQEWSWVACGTLIVALREGKYWAVDGQHRLMATLRRSDVQELPCVVFEMQDIKEEAKGFVSANTQRKPISSSQRHKAMVISGNEIAVMVQSQIQELGLSTTVNKKSPGYFSCIAWAMKTAKDDYDTFCAVLKIAAEISLKDSEPVRQKLLDGLAYIHKHHSGGIRDPRIADKIRQKGAFTLNLAAQKSAAILGHGGQKAWARGILDELNKGLQKKFYVSGLA